MNHLYKKYSMKVLQIIPSLTNYFTFLDELTASCMDQSIDVALVSSSAHFDSVTCYADKPRCQYFPVDIPQGMNPIAHFRAAGKIRKIIEEYQPDIIHAHIGAGIFSASLAKKEDWPSIVSTHHGLLGPSMAGLKGRIASFAETLAMLRMEQVYLLNESDKKWLTSKTPVKKITVYASKGLGCRSDVFDRSKVPSRKTQSLKRQLGIEEGDFVFIFVGRHVWFKGFDLTVKAFECISRKFPFAKLVLLGEPYRVHPTGLSELEMCQFKSNSSIVSVGWVDNVEEFLALSDVNIFPSEREGMPVNLMESICMGVPVITRDTRGCNEIVEHNQTGYLMKERSLDELVTYMEMCLSSPDVLKSMKERCLEVRGRFDRKLWIDEQIEHYRSMLEGRQELC